MSHISMYALRNVCLNFCFPRIIILTTLRQDDTGNNSSIELSLLCLIWNLAPGLLNYDYFDIWYTSLNNTQYSFQEKLESHISGCLCVMSVEHQTLAQLEVCRF